MLRLKCLVAACVLAMSVGHVKANTLTIFDASGSFTDPFQDIFALSGSIGVDSTSAVVSNASLFLVGEPWTIIVAQSGSNLSIQTPIFNVGFSPANCTTTNRCHDTLNLLFSGDPSVWLADHGASILSGSALLRDAGFSIRLESGEISEEMSVTPLPAAFPLLASGLGGLALFGWWRKRRAAATDAGICGRDFSGDAAINADGGVASLASSVGISNSARQKKSRSVVAVMSLQCATR